MSNLVIDLLDDSSSDEEEEKKVENCLQRPSAHIIRNPYLKDPLKNAPEKSVSTAFLKKKAVAKAEASKSSSKARKTATMKYRKDELQAGVVFEHTDAANSTSSENTVAMYAQEQNERKARGERSLLYHDQDFATVPTSIEGRNKKEKVACRCKGTIEARLSYKKQNGRPYYHCTQNKCKFFKWAFQAEQMQWYRFGDHNKHCIVGPNGFSADDLLQGKVGDCWFLSALAVVAERPDLILRLFGNGKFNSISKYGMVQVNLFQDGHWKTITLDNFLPCMVDDTSERDLQRALQASMGVVSRSTYQSSTSREESSKHDPHALSDACKIVLKETTEFIERDKSRLNQPLPGRSAVITSPQILQREAASADLAYSKAKHNQLWVPFLEKAYAKSHGCYQAISGGWIAEAFLDLTGAPTLSFIFEHKNFNPRWFWSKLLQWRRKRLPMGCGTSQSQEGIIGMHAYSILDVQEVINVDYSFFQSTGVAHGNVSGFVEFDGKVRLLRIRNPHGKGEWKGDFSDKSQIWKKLLFASNDIEATNLQRTMKNDGSFWIDYDNFLMGFHDVDVVLAFLGNHAKSFSSNFPEKKSSHRCARAFEVSLLDDLGEPYTEDTVELYIMGVQKTKRGAKSGRADRKVSYKPCDLGVLVAEIDHVVGSIDYESMTFKMVKGEMFGLKRNGHFSVVLKRKEKNKRLLVMPISFGHPAATDKELSFVLRFVSDAPLFIQECSSVPRMDLAIQSFCRPHNAHSNQNGIRKVILKGSTYCLIQVQCQKTVFLYLVVNESELKKQKLDESGLCFSIEANCRGMFCRTENGLLQHQTVAKGKKFTAAHRRYNCEFLHERLSRLLLVLVQSGQDTEFTFIVATQISTAQKLGSRTVNQSSLDTYLDIPSVDTQKDYKKRGIFNCVNECPTFDFASNLKCLQPHAALEIGPDLDLQQAMVLSRDEIELQQALEMSKREASSSHPMSHYIDYDLENTIEASKNSSILSSTSLFDDDLSKALQFSLQDQEQKPRAKVTKDIVVDLTEDATPTKRQKTDNSDDIAISLDNKMSDSNAAATNIEDKKPTTLDEKRKLAREAALKRLTAKDKIF